MAEVRRSFELAENQTFALRVRSRNRLGTPSAWSDSLVFNTTKNTAGLGGPLGLIVTPAIRSIILTWTANTEPNFSYYEIYVSRTTFGTADPTPEYKYGDFSGTIATIKRVWEPTGATPGMNDLFPGTQYFIKIRAVTTSGVFSPFSAEVTTHTGFVGNTDFVFNSISGDKIQVGTLSADKIIAGSITGDEIAANTITAVNIAANTITAGNLAALNLTVGQQIKSSNYVANSTGWRILGTGAAEFSSVTLRNPIHSSTISACIVHQGGIQTIPDNSLTKVVFSTQEYASGGMGNSNNGLTIARTGFYQINAMVSWAVWAFSALGWFRMTVERWNSSETVFQEEIILTGFYDAAGVAAGWSNQGCCMAKCFSGERLIMRVIHQSGSAKDLEASAFGQIRVRSLSAIYLGEP